MTTPKASVEHERPRAMLIIAALMVLFGIAEVVTSFTHSFFGLSTSETVLSTVIGATLGICYLASGLLLLTGRKWAALLAIILLCIDVAGRVAMVLTGLYPLGSFRQAFGIIVGT